MTSKVAQYSILTEPDVGSLLDVVNTSLNSGWVLHGNLIVIYQSGGGNQYAQAMVKYSPPPKGGDW